MKKTLITLSLVSCALLAEDVKLKDFTISATEEPTVFETQEIEYQPEFRNTLPSNISSISSFSGIKIDGATSDFTSVYWNGIEVTDPSNTNNYPTLMNSGRSGADVISIDGSNINYKTQAKDSVEIQGGDPKFGRFSLAKTIETENTIQTLRLDGLYEKMNTAYTNQPGEYNDKEEKDELKTLDISYLGRFKINEIIGSNISLLHKKVDYQYDGYNFLLKGTDANDSTSSYDNKLIVEFSLKAL